MIEKFHRQPWLPELTDRALFAHELTGLRERAGLTIRELATKLNIPAATLGGYFSGSHLPPLRQPSVLTAVLIVCGVSDPATIEHWEAALRRLRRIPGPRPGSSQPPYRGLASFGPDDAEWFRGRDALTATLLDSLPSDGHGALMVVGPSGAGKSSLLQAGLVPALKARSIDVAVCAPTVESLDSAGPGVVIVDQLEEIFTESAADDRDAVLAVLAARQGPVILALRSDFYSHALRHRFLAEALQERQLIVGPMNEAELREAICEPARQAGIDLESGLVELLLRDSRSAPTSGALPLLSHALLSTWERGRRNSMRIADYHATGGIAGAVAATAEEQFQDLDHRQQRFIRRTLLRLVHSDGALLSRRRIRRAELPSADPHDQDALDGFIDRRLLIVDEDHIEIAHEALLWAWPRLSEWIDADRAGLRIHRQLTASTAEWVETDHDSQALLRGVRLANVREWAAEHEADLNELEGRYLDLSIANERREQLAARQRTRRLKQLLGVAAAMSVLAAASAFYAFTERGNADRQRDLAVSRELAITADQLRATDVALAAQLAVTAYRIAPTTQARSSLLHAFSEPMPTRLVGPTGAVQAAATTSDGRIAAMGAVDNSIRMWDTASAKPLGPPLLGHTGTIFAAVFSPDGHELASAGADRSIRLWHVGANGGVASATATGAAENTIYALAFHPSLPVLIAGSADGTTTLWHVNDLGPPIRIATIATSAAAVHAVAISPDGRTLAAGSADNTVHLYDISRPSTPIAYPPLPAGSRKVLSVAFSPDRSLLAAGSADFTVRLWNIGRPDRPTVHGVPLTGPTGWVNTVAFSPDGQLIAGGSSDEKTWIWRTDTGVSAGVLPHPAQVTSLQFTSTAAASGSVLTTGAYDGVLRRWAIPGPVIRGPNAPVFNALPAGPQSVTVIVASDNAFTLWRTDNVRNPRSLGPPVSNAGMSSRGSGAGGISPDARTVAIGGVNGDVQLWDVSTVEHPIFRSTLHAHTGPIEAVMFSADSRTLAIASDDHTATLWTVADPARPTRLGAPLPAQNIVYSPVFSPDGRLLALGTADRTVLLWDVHDPAHPVLLHSPLPGATSTVFAVAFSPDGKVLAAADNSIRFWDISDPRRPTVLGEPLTGPDRTIWSLAYAPDGRTLAAGTGDGKIWLWATQDTHHPTLLATLPAHAGSVNTLAFDAATGALVSGGADRLVRLWSIDPEQVAALICSTAGDAVTPAEWARYVPDRAYQPPC